MSIYLYSVRAKSMAILVDGTAIRAHTLEMLHTNWNGMYDDRDCHPGHRRLQASAVAYWEKHGLPDYVFHKIDEDRFDLYRWTSKTPFWIDTDRIPGEFMGEIGPGKILKRHRCEDHARELYASKIVCGNGSCRRTLEARPGEIDAIRAKDAEERRRSQERHEREQLIRHPYLEAKRKLDDLGTAWHRGGYDIERAQADVKRLTDELAKAEERVRTLSADRNTLASSWHAFKPEVDRLEKEKDEALEKLRAEYEAPAVQTTDR